MAQIIDERLITPAYQPLTHDRDLALGAARTLMSRVEPLRAGSSGRHLTAAGAA